MSVLNSWFISGYYLKDPGHQNHIWITVYFGSGASSIHHLQPSRLQRVDTRVETCEISSIMLNQAKGWNEAIFSFGLIVVFLLMMGI